MFTFIYARHKIHPKLNKYHQQWYLLIDNWKSLLEFVEIRSKKLVSDYFYIKSRRSEGFKGHFGEPWQVALEMSLNLDENRKGLVDDIKHIDKFTDSYINSFLSWGNLVVSPNYAFRDMDDTFKILDKIEKKDFVFPDSKLSEEDIKILRFPEGSHYYVIINGITIVDPETGEGKWKTYKAAKRVADEYIERNMEESD
jgi:hypothetical protein